MYEASVQCVSNLIIYFFQSHSLSDAWKTAIVKPLLKKGSLSNPSNYRPISLTLVVCKIFETVTKKYLLIYLDKFFLISKDQHGFLSNHSCSTNLLECLNDWTKCLDDNNFVKIV